MIISRKNIIENKITTRNDLDDIPTDLSNLIFENNSSMNKTMNDTLIEYIKVAHLVKKTKSPEILVSMSKDINNSILEIIDKYSSNIELVKERFLNIKKYIEIKGDKSTIDIDETGIKFDIPFKYNIEKITDINYPNLTKLGSDFNDMIKDVSECIVNSSIYSKERNLNDYYYTEDKTLNLKSGSMSDVYKIYSEDNTFYKKDIMEFSYIHGNINYITDMLSKLSDIFKLISDKLTKDNSSLPKLSLVDDYITIDYYNKDYKDFKKCTINNSSEYGIVADNLIKLLEESIQYNTILFNSIAYKYDALINYYKTMCSLFQGNKDYLVKED